MPAALIKIRERVSAGTDNEWENKGLEKYKVCRLNNCPKCVRISAN